jgi:pimeloyl-ACP methyl ester carboxylesterase
MKEPMKLKFLISLFFSHIIFSSQPDFLDATFLNNPADVQKCLINNGFTKVFFTTHDGLKLCGLFKDQSQNKKIEGTILYCAGFYPGTKEGMASFYTLFENQPYNFLMFDARGHQESEGSLFSYQSLKNYGNVEFQDIVAAVNFLNAYNQTHDLNQNIIIHGICSGAFHAMKAYDFFREHDCTAYDNVKKIIFDSGWLKMTDIVEPTLCAEIHKRLKNSLFSWLTQPLCYFTLQWYRLTLKHHHQNISGIADIIDHAQCPILFVHCINDPYVPIVPVQNLVNHLQCPNSWWITHDAHANFHTQAPEIYTKKIMHFLKPS